MSSYYVEHDKFYGQLLRDQKHVAAASARASSRGSSKHKNILTTFVHKLNTESQPNSLFTGSCQLILQGHFFSHHHHHQHYAKQSKQQPSAPNQTDCYEQNNVLNILHVPCQYLSANQFHWVNHEFPTLLATHSLNDPSLHQFTHVLCCAAQEIIHKIIETMTRQWIKKHCV